MVGETGTDGRAPARSGRARKWLATGAIAVGFAVCFAPSLPVAFERDEGEYAHAADLLLSGGVPYRDTFLQKPPGIVLAYAAVIAWTRDDTVGVHALGLAALACTIVALVAAVAALGSDAAAIAAALLAAMAFLSPVNEPFPANTEVFLLPAATAAFALLAAAGRRPRAGRDGSLLPAAASGLCIGIATLFKQVAAVHAPHLLLGWWIVGRRARRAPALAAAFALAAALPWALALSWWAARGALGPFLDGVLLHNLRYVSFNPEGAPLDLLRARIAACSWFDCGFWTAGLAGALALVAQRRWWAAFVAGGWLVGAIVAISSGGYFRGHYLLQAIPGLAACAALAGERLPRAFGPAVLAGLLGSWIAAWPFLFGIDPAMQSLRRYGGLRFQNSPAVGRLLRASAQGVPGARLFVMGSEPQIYHESGLAPVTRWAIFSPLTGGYAGGHDLQEAAWRDVSAALPEFVVVSVPAAVPLFRHSDTTLYERVARLVRERYRPIAKTSAVHLGLVPPGDRVPPGFAPDLWLFRRDDLAAAGRQPDSLLDWPPVGDLRPLLLPGRPDLFPAGGGSRR